MLIGGIVYHAQFMVHLRETRKWMTRCGLIHGESSFPMSLTLITAIILLFVGIAAIASMLFRSVRLCEKAHGKAFRKEIIRKSCLRNPQPRRRRKNLRVAQNERKAKRKRLSL